MEFKDLIAFADTMLAALQGTETPGRKLVMLGKLLTEEEAKVGPHGLVQGRGPRGYR